MSGKQQTDFDILMDYDIDIRSRTLFFQESVDEESSANFIKKLKYLDKTIGDITIIMNSGGGCVTSGFAMYDSIKDCQNQVTIRVVGCAMSIASIVLQAADKRIMGKNARLMIHRGELSVNDHVTNVKKAVRESDELEDMMIGIYMEKIKESKKTFRRSELQKLLDFDTYISADRCLSLGLIDEIIGDDD